MPNQRSSKFLYSFLILALVSQVLPVRADAEETNESGEKSCFWETFGLDFGKNIYNYFSVNFVQAAEDFWDIFQANISDFNPWTFLFDIYSAYKKTNDVAPDINAVTFYLHYNNSNCAQREILYFNNSESIESSHYNKSLRLIIITHGFMGDSNSTVNNSAVDIRNGYCNASYFGVVANFIIVDWSAMSGPKEEVITSYFGLLVPYICAANNVYLAAKRIGQMLVFMYDNGFLMPWSEKANVMDIHAIGHSLGAHVMGIACADFTKATSRVARRLTGTDPAAPNFRWKEEKDRFNKNQADFVDVVHCNGGELGIEAPLGDCDFYVNRREGIGRLFQPQCMAPNGYIEDPISCSHQLCPKFFAHSVLNTSITATCRKHVDDCNSQNVTFGEAVSSTCRGQYRVSIMNPINELI